MFIKRFLKILAWFFGILFGLLIIAYFLLQLPAVQTYVAQKAANWLSNKIGAKVEIEGVDIQFFDTAILEGIYVEDKKKDTLLYAKRLYVGITDFSTSESWVNLSKITLSNARIGLRKYPDENGLNFQFIVDAFKSDKKTTTKSKPFDLKCGALNLVNSKFSYTIVGAKAPEWGFDARNIVASNINADFENLHMHGDTVDADMRKLTAIEHSGLILQDMNCKFHFSNHMMVFEDMALKSSGSVVNGTVGFNFNSFRAFAHPFDSVNVNFDIKNADVQMADVAYFAPFLKGINLKAKLKGKFTGRLNKLKGKSIELFYGSKTHFAGDITMNNLSNTKELFIDARIKSLVTNANDIATIPLPPFSERNRIELPPEVYRLGQIAFNGSFQGFLNSFVAEGTFNTALGSVVTDLQLAQIEGTKIMAYDGHVATGNFKLGDLLPNQGLGIMSVNVAVDGKGFDLKTIDTQVKGHVTALDFNEYRYSNIDIDGQLVKTEFTGRVESKDPNMQLAFNGTMSFGKNVPIYNFDAEVVRADLKALNLIDKDSSLVISARLSSNITGNTLETLNGKIEAEDVEIIYGNTTYPVGHMVLYSDVATKPKQLRLISDVADVNIIGEYKLETVGKAMVRTINSFLPSYLSGAKATDAAENTQNFSFNIQLKNTEPITAIFVPDLKVSPGGNFIGTYKSEQDALTLTGSLKEVEYRDIAFNGISISSRTQNNTLYLSTNIQRLEPADSVFIDNIIVSAFSQNDTLTTDIDFENNIDSVKNTGSIHAIAHFQDKNIITVTLPKLNLDAFSYHWRVDPDNQMVIDGSRISISKLVLKADDESFRAFGNISTDPNDQLNIIFTKFNLANINRFVPPNTVQLTGYLNGSFSVSSLYSQPLFRSTMRVNNLSLNGNYLGSGNIFSNWDKDNKVINVDAALLRNDTVKSVMVKGKYYPTRQDDNLDLNVSVNKFDLTTINRYVKGTVSFARGDANSEFTVTGSTDKPKVHGYIFVRRPIITIDYLGTTYNFVDTIKMKNDKIVLKDLVLYDNNNAKNTAVVNGEVTHKAFTDWAYNVSIRAKNFLCLNTQQTPDALYYGTAYVTGLIGIKGDLKKTTINADVKTNPNTRFYIPLSNPNSASSNEYIYFVDHDSLLHKKTKKAERASIGIILNLDLEVTPDAEVQIIFDKQVGDIIKGNGSGNLKMNIDTKGDFRMYGDYFIEKGEYLFTLKNLINKKFVVEKGGTISWSGDVYKANVDLTALYRLNASFAPIMSLVNVEGEELEAYRKKLPVDCRLSMTGDLLTPNLGFALATGTTDDKARAALSSIQSNQEELNKQIFALLLLRQFLPPSQSGLASGAGNSANYGSGFSDNGFELLSSQLSSFLSQISDQFDINVSFVPGTNGGPPQVEIGTTVRFGDKVSLDVSAGNTTSGSSSTDNTNQQITPPPANTIVSDFNLDVKISKDGRLRARVFNRSNQNVISQGDIPYTQGAGISYRREFNKLSDLFRRRKKTTVSPTTPANPPASSPSPANNNTATPTEPKLETAPQTEP